jgi:serine/threonine protein kinase/tetratricopeptide (TPR) repeat protein
MRDLAQNSVTIYPFRESPSGTFPLSSWPPLDPPPDTLPYPMAAQLATGSTVAGRYRISGLIGVGGMGIVYRAHDEQLDIDVALKVLRPELAGDARFRDRFRRELLLARQVSHRHAVRIHDLGVDGDLLFMTMDFISGRSLRAVLAAGALPTRRAATIAQQLAEAMVTAHREGIVHRDLKPANVLIDEAGRAYLSDFGVARSMAAASMTLTGGVIGTPDYLSPEQARGEAVDGRSDLYSLGLVLFEMVSGRLPFDGASPSERIAQRINGRAVDLHLLGPDSSPLLRSILRRLLEADPERRYQTAEAVAVDLLLLGSDHTTEEWPLRWHPRRSRPRLLRASEAALLFSCSIAAVAPHNGLAATALRSNVALPTHIVAILPFAEQSGHPDLAWSSAGIAEMLSSSLGESRTVRVVDSLRLLRAVGDLKLAPGPLAPAELRQVADLVAADRLVTGVVRVVGQTLRIDAQLVALDAQEPQSTTLKVESADESEVFHLIDELGGSLRRGLEISADASAAAPLSRSPQALSAYATGLQALARADTLGAVKPLESAVAADSQFAAAWLRLASCYQALGESDKAQSASAHAVASPAAASGRLSFEARAQRESLVGHPDAAADLLRGLVRRYPHDLEAQTALAQAYGEQGQLDAEAATLRQVVRADPHHPRAWTLLGQTLIEQGRSRQAIDDALVHAMVVQNRLGSDQGRADVLNALGVGYQELGDLQRAEDNYREAATIRERIGDRRGYATSLKNLATLSLVRGALPEAERDLNKGLAILTPLGDKAGLAELDNALGGLDEERGQYDKALAHYRSALELRRILGNTLSFAQSLNNIGFTYQQLGEFDNAMAYWQQALTLERGSGDRAGAVNTLQSVAQLDIARGAWTDSLRGFLDTLNESRDLGLKPATAVSIGFLGRVAQRQGRYRAALASYDEALAVVRTLDDRRGEVEFGLYAVEALDEIGQSDAARTRLAALATRLAGDTSSVERSASDEEQWAELEAVRGNVLLRAGDVGGARAAFRRGLQHAARSHSVVAQLELRLGMARTELPLGAASRQAELRAVLDQAERLGDIPTQLAARESLADAELQSGDRNAAAATARKALHLIDRCGSYAGAYRVHLILARALNGQPEAMAERSAAGREAQRLESDLTREQRTTLTPRIERTFTAMASSR